MSDSSPQEILGQGSNEDGPSDAPLPLQGRHNSNDSQPEMNLCDIMSSFPSLGSHSVSNSLAKRPFEQVGNLSSLQKTQSMGFGEQANFKLAAGGQRVSSGAGPGFFSQRLDSTSKSQTRSSAQPLAGEKRTF